MSLEMLGVALSLEGSAFLLCCQPGLQWLDAAGRGQVFAHAGRMFSS